MKGGERARSGRISGKRKSERQEDEEDETTHVSPRQQQHIDNATCLST